MHSAKHWLLLLALIAGTKTVHAQMCYPVGAYMTLLGRAVAEHVQLSDGSSKDIWMLAMDPPLCVIDKRYSQDSQGRMSVSRVQIVGAVPPTGVPLMLTGTLSTRNAPQYFIVPTALSVVPPNVRLAPGQ